MTSYTAHRLIVRRETVTVSGCICSDDLCVAVSGNGQGGGVFRGASDLASLNYTNHLLFNVIQSGRQIIVFYTICFSSVEVHLINVSLCQGSAQRLAASPASLRCVCSLKAKTEGFAVGNWVSEHCDMTKCYTFFFCSQDLGVRPPLN